MPDDSSRRTLLSKAEELSRKYSWMEAAAIYGKIFEAYQQKNEGLEEARVLELRAKCYFKGAFQSKSPEEFDERLKQARAAYENAASLFDKSGSDVFSKQSRARSGFASYWLAGRAERPEIASKCVELGEKAVEAFEASDDKVNLAQARLDLLWYASEECSYLIEWKPVTEHLEKALKIGRKAIEEFEITGDLEGLVESLNLTLALEVVLAWGVLEASKFKELLPEIRTLANRLRKSSEKAGSAWTSGLAGEIAGWMANLLEGDNEKSTRILEAAYHDAEPSGDLYLLGRLANAVNCAAIWVGTKGVHSETRRRSLENGAEYGWKAVKNFGILKAPVAMMPAYDFLAECHTITGLFVETEPEKKAGQFRKAIEVARNEVPLAPIPDACHALSKALYFLATTITDPHQKQQLLTEALRYRRGVVSFFDAYSPYAWDRGIQRNYLALIKSDLSRLETNHEAKVSLLESAVEDMQLCVDLCAKWAEGTGTYSSMLSAYEDWYGGILDQLYQLTGNVGLVEKAVEIYKDAIARRVSTGRDDPAPLSWKLARLYDSLGDFSKASEAFKEAGAEYRASAKNVERLASSFGELPSYMDAWVLIEKARLRHSQEQFSLAASDYSAAAKILQPTRSWSHLSTHYQACSLLEQGEAASRQEKQEDAIQSLTSAASKFQSARLETDGMLKAVAAPDEKAELSHWSAVSLTRERFCRGRIELEEARILDKKGEEEASALKYRSAAETFQGLQSQTETDVGRREMETLRLFCEAWAQMKEAEVAGSPETYSRAAELFLNVEKVSRTKRHRLLALANASMCKALQSGTLFRRTRETGLYSEVKKHLETAGDHYQEAGFQNAALWTQATGRLFDALVYLTEAETERERRKKTELFHLAEKHLEVAAKLYGEAGYQTKRDEALRNLGRARGEKELLLTPLEALNDNPALAGASVAPVSLIRDKASGLERFEAANVVGNVSVQGKGLSVGSDLTLEVEMANVGRTAATLVKLENVGVEGLEVDRSRIGEKLEDNFIDMKGRRLEYLKTHEVKVPLKVKRKGAFQLRPRILFVDEGGNYRSYQFEAVALDVTELGISGWLKGPK